MWVGRCWGWNFQSGEWKSWNGVMAWSYLDGSGCDSGCDNALAKWEKWRSKLFQHFFLFMWLWLQFIPECGHTWFHMIRKQSAARLFPRVQGRSKIKHQIAGLGSQYLYGRKPTILIYGQSMGWFLEKTSPPPSQTAFAGLGGIRIRFRVSWYLPHKLTHLLECFKVASLQS